MGQGKDLGLQLRQWLDTEPETLRSGRSISNRLVDALGADDSLKGPIRDLATQPLLLDVLHSHGGRQRSAMASLQQQLAYTYAPAVLGELLDLLEAASGLAIAARATSAESAEPPEAGAGARISTRLQLFQPTLKAIGPGMALAASGALVLAWLARELDRGLFDGWGWSGGVVLVLVLGLLQALSLGPLKELQRRWPLNAQQALQPRQAWRWLGAAWIHEHNLEAVLNLLLLLVLLGDSAAQLSDVVLRYSLTALATLVPAVILAAHWGLDRQWSGAAGPISALIGLAASLSLLHERTLTFDTPLFSVPAWVLLLLYGALQLHWQLPADQDNHNGTPLQRLLCSPWTWGLMAGMAWGVVTWGQSLIR